MGSATVGLGQGDGDTDEGQPHGTQMRASHMRTWVEDSPAPPAPLTSGLQNREQQVSGVCATPPNLGYVSPCSPCRPGQPGGHRPYVEEVPTGWTALSLAWALG